MDGLMPGSVWEKIRAKTGSVLGEDFWEDIGKYIPNQMPRTDVFLSEGTLFVVTEVPGISNAGSIQLSCNGKSLQIQGNIPYDYPVQPGSLARKERFTGAFARKIELPTDVFPDSASARIRNGLLIVKLLPKPEEGDKKIPVEMEGD